MKCTVEIWDECPGEMAGTNWSEERKPGRRTNQNSILSELDGRWVGNIMKVNWKKYIDKKRIETVTIRKGRDPI